MKTLRITLIALFTLLTILWIYWIITAEVDVETGIQGAIINEAELVKSFKEGLRFHFLLLVISPLSCLATWLCIKKIKIASAFALISILSVATSFFMTLDRIPAYTFVQKLNSLPRNIEFANYAWWTVYITSALMAFYVISIKGKMKNT